MVVLWAFTARRGDATAVDVAWAVQRSACSWCSTRSSPTAGSATVLVAVIVGGLGACASGPTSLVGRVLHGDGEDGRYATLRERWGRRGREHRASSSSSPPRRGSTVVFSIAFVADRPERATTRSRRVRMWARARASGRRSVGEATADRQLARWKADPANRGVTCRGRPVGLVPSPELLLRDDDVDRRGAHRPRPRRGAGSAFVTPSSCWCCCSPSPASRHRSAVAEQRREDYRRYQEETSMFIPLARRRRAARRDDRPRAGRRVRCVPDPPAARRDPDPLPPAAGPRGAPHGDASAADARGGAARVAARRRGRRRQRAALRGARRVLPPRPRPAAEVQRLPLAEPGTTTLAAAEEAMLDLTCGAPGSRTAWTCSTSAAAGARSRSWIAERYPACRITAVEQLGVPGREIGSRRARTRTSRSSPPTSARCELDAPLRPRACRWRCSSTSATTRCCSARIAPLARAGRPAVRATSSAIARYTYLYDRGWMARDVLHRRDDARSRPASRASSGTSTVEEDWVVGGEHYARTAEAWLGQPRCPPTLRSARVLAAAYGDGRGRRRAGVLAGLLPRLRRALGIRGGREWLVSRYLFWRR